MNRISSLALITFKEGIRNRSIYGIALFSLFILGLNVAVSGFFMRDIGKVTVDMNLGALSFAGLLLVFFVEINLMAKDIDKKTIHLVLSKPISRVEYVWGKFFGMELIILVSLAVLMLLSSATVALLGGLYADYFGTFSWTGFFIACFFIYVKLSVLNAIVIFFSTLSSNSFITLIFAISCFIAGVTIEEVVFYLQTAFAAKQLAISDSLRVVMDVISYVVPNLSVFDFKTAAAHGLEIGSERILFALAYAATYIGALLVVASLIFKRREFN